MNGYSWWEVYDWLEPMLTDAEFALGLRLDAEAVRAALVIPVGDHWR